MPDTHGLEPARSPSQRPFSGQPQQPPAPEQPTAPAGDPRRQPTWHAPHPGSDADTSVSPAGTARTTHRLRRSRPSPAGAPVLPAETSGLRGLLQRLGLLNPLRRTAKYYPARLAIMVFAAIIAMDAAMLRLPVATASGRPAPAVDALFTATSAVCVTGLTTVETASYWSTFGQTVIILGAAVGGLGIMTLTSLMSLMVSRHLGLTQRMLAASETKSRLGDVVALLRAALFTAVSCELLLAAVLLPRFLTQGVDLDHALWYALFMAMSIFNNAGFVILPEGLAPYASDWWMGMPIVLGTVMGALGFPVILDILRNRRRPRTWSLHTKLTLTTYGVLSVVSALAIAAFEWNNPDTYGSLPTGGRILTALINGVNARSSGLSTIDTGHMSEATWFLQDALMFVGGGFASTAGGIKVTTLAVLVLAIVAEARGDQDIEAFGRRINSSTLRLSVAVAFVGASIVGVATILLIQMTHLSLDRVLFEVISAFATVGLSTGITPLLPSAAKYVMVALMFVGRVGTITAVSALAMRQRQRVIRMPEGMPLIG